jgi:hypothetical protein
MEQDSLGVLISKRYGELDANRGNWKDYWSRLLKFIHPDRDNVYGERTEGQKVNSQVFDGTAIRANRDLANAMVSLLMNPATKWMNYSTMMPEIDADDGVNKFLDNATRITLNSLLDSNFYTAVHEALLDDGAIGTSALLILDDEDGIHVECQPIFEWVVAENNKRVIDVGYRKYKFTLRQMVQEFGEEFMEGDDELTRCYKNTPDKQYEIIQAIEPKATLSKHYPEIEKKTGLPYVSVHVLCGKNKVLKVSGFASQPLVVSRHSRQSGELYGRCPGMEAFPDIKTANALKKIILVGGQLAIAPPLQATDNSVMRGVKLRPYGMTFRRPGSDPIEPLFTGARPEIGFDLLQGIQEDINKFFYIDQLRTIQADRMTATEIMQRRDEQFRSFGAILARKDNELIKPIVNRIFQILFDKGVFGEVPEKLAEVGGKISVVYSSMISKAMLAAEAENFTRAMQISEPVFSLDPAVADNINSDKVLRSNFRTMGVNADFLRTEQERDGLRKARAENEAAQQEMAMGQAQAQVQETAAKAGKLRSETQEEF